MIAPNTILYVTNGISTSKQHTQLLQSLQTADASRNPEFCREVLTILHSKTCCIIITHFSVVLKAFVG